MRRLTVMLSSLACTAAMTVLASPASAADFDYAEDLPEIELVGVDLAAGRACNTSVKTRLTLSYRVSSSTYSETISATGKSTCATERLAITVSVSDSSVAMQTYTAQRAAVESGSVSASAGQVVPARLVAQVKYRWNFVPRYSPPQCFEKTYTVVRGQSPQAGDTKPCAEPALNPGEES